MSEDIYILGINMTKFGKHKELDTLDLASEATLAALKDGGVTMKDMGMIAAGNLMGGARPIAQDDPEAVSDRPASPPTTSRMPARPVRDGAPGGLS